MRPRKLFIRALNHPSLLAAWRPRNTDVFFAMTVRRLSLAAALLLACPGLLSVLGACAKRCCSARGTEQKAVIALVGSNVVYRCRSGPQRRTAGAGDRASMAAAAAAADAATPAVYARTTGSTVSAPGGAGHALLFRDHVLLKQDFKVRCCRACGSSKRCVMGTGNLTVP